jgi:hypothetical protein
MLTGLGLIWTTYNVWMLDALNWFYYGPAAILIFIYFVGFGYLVDYQETLKMKGK